MSFSSVDKGVTIFLLVPRDGIGWCSVVGTLLCAQATSGSMAGAGPGRAEEPLRSGLLPLASRPAGPENCEAPAAGCGAASVCVCARAGVCVMCVHILANHTHVHMCMWLCARKCVF